jgi:DNA-damage-inducible protein J
MTTLTLKSVDVRSRIDPHLKQSASDILLKCGLDISTAIRLFLQNVVAYQGIPFEIKVPNAQTVLAMNEARAISQSRQQARFATGEELINDLDKISRAKTN